MGDGSIEEIYREVFSDRKGNNSKTKGGRTPPLVIHINLKSIDVNPPSSPQNQAHFFRYLWALPLILLLVVRGSVSIPRLLSQPFA